MKTLSKFEVDVSGLGIIIYSPFATQSISAGEDYFTASFSSGPLVSNHLRKGTIIGIATGSPGHYVISALLGGYPAETFDFVVRVALEVRNGIVCVRDLYDLMDWAPECPSEQRFCCPDGKYEVMAYSNRPASGIIGDNQSILLTFNEISEIPELSQDGIPILYCSKPG